MPVVFAFGLAPAVFVAAHFYTLIRYDMLAGTCGSSAKTWRRWRCRRRIADRCRQLLANVEFVNALAMPKGSRASSWMFSWTVRALLAVFPVVVLLLVQLQSLRLQSEWVNWTHHACIAADLVLLVWFFGRLRVTTPGISGPHRSGGRSRCAGCRCVIIAVDLAWLQVPGPDSQTAGKDLAAYLRQYPEAPASLMQRVGWWARSTRSICCFARRAPGDVGSSPSRIASSWPRYGMRQPSSRCVPARMLDAKHLASFEGASLSGRTLRFADLTASELFAADLTDADLRHAVLSTTLQRGLKNSCRVPVRGPVAGRQPAADAQLQGANLAAAQLQGADLCEAQLQGADLRGAQLQGANLIEAQLQGANLSEAQLQGANLVQAQLQGAALRGRSCRAPTCAGRSCRAPTCARPSCRAPTCCGRDYGTSTPTSARLGLADLREANFNEVSAENLLAKLSAATPEVAKQQLRERLAAKAAGAELPPQIDTTDGKILVTNPDDTAWQNLDRTTQLTTEPADIDPALARLLADTVAPTSSEAAEVVASACHSLTVG